MRLQASTLPMYLIRVLGPPSRVPMREGTCDVETQTCVNGQTSPTPPLGSFSKISLSFLVPCCSTHLRGHHCDNQSGKSVPSSPIAQPPSCRAMSAERYSVRGKRSLPTLQSSSEPRPQIEPVCNLVSIHDRCEISLRQLHRVTFASSQCFHRRKCLCSVHLLRSLRDLPVVHFPPPSSNLRTNRLPF